MEIGSLAKFKSFDRQEKYGQVNNKRFTSKDSDVNVEAQYKSSK